MERELKPIIDDSWFLSPDADSIERAARTNERRAMGWRNARVRPFGKQARKARALAGITWAAVVTGTLIVAALGVAANAGV